MSHCKRWIKNSRKKLRSNCLFPWFLSSQSCASLTSAWSSHHLGSLTSWWRGQTGPGELLFHPITQPLLKTEGQRRRARRRRERQERGSTEREREWQQKPSIWFSVTGQGRKEIRKNLSFSGCLSHFPCLCQTWKHGDRWSTQRPSLCFFLCLRVRGNYEPGRVLSLQRGCLITCLSAIHKIYCISCAYGLNGNHMWKSWECKEMIGHRC